MFWDLFKKPKHERYAILRLCVSGLSSEGINDIIQTYKTLLNESGIFDKVLVIPMDGIKQTSIIMFYDNGKQIKQGI